MSSYYLNEAVFDLTERAFADKTIHGLESKLPGDKTLGVFVHRRPVDGGKPLRQLVDDNIALNKKRLSGYAVLDRIEAAVGGVPAIMLRTRWRLGTETFYQLQALVALGPSASGDPPAPRSASGDATLLIFAVSAPLTEQAVCDETFDCILQSITWRTG